MTPGRLRYLEDFAPGLELDLGLRTFTREEIVAFASLHDPQPFHLSEEGGAASPFGTLVASGWQTATAMVRLMLDHLVPRGGRIISMGVEAEWHRPVLPDAPLHVTGRIADVTPSQSNPQRGWIHIEIEARDAAGALTAVVRTRGIVDRAPA